MTHRISEADIGYDAFAVLEEWFSGYMTMNDGRQYRVVQIGGEDRRLTVQVEGTQHLDVEEDQFEIEVVVRRVDR